MLTTFLIDGGFFLRRLRFLRGAMPPRDAARIIPTLCLQHLRHENRSRRQLYRIFYYDCPPLSKKAHNPVSNRAINFSESGLAAWRLAFFEELKSQRKVALRLGHLQDGGWRLRGDKLKLLLARKITVSDLTESDVTLEIRQQAVDMRIGLDIASLAYKRLVDQIVLFSGDSDFVPAAKLARREGIDVILDPMWLEVSPDLREHIDGLHSPIRAQTRSDQGPTTSVES